MSDAGAYSLAVANRRMDAELMVLGTSVGTRGHKEDMVRVKGKGRTRAGVHGDMAGRTAELAQAAWGWA